MQRARANLGLTLADVRSAILAILASTIVVHPDYALRHGLIPALLVLLLAAAEMRKWLFEGADLAFVAYATFAALSLSWTTAHQQTSLGVKNTISCVVIFVAVRVSLRRVRDIRLLGAGLIAGGLYGTYRLLAQNANAGLRFQYDATAERLGIDGLNYNALAYGLSVSAVAVVLFVATMERPRKAVLIVASFCCVLLWSGVILSGTRGALVALIAGSAWLVACRLTKQHARLLFLLSVVAIAATAAITFGLIDHILAAAVGHSGRDTGSLNGRLILWPIARDIFWNYPLGGAGLDAIMGPVNPLGIAAHNMLLDIASGLGVVGVVLFVFGVILALRGSGPAGARRSFAVGTWIAVVTPIALSGYWIEGPAFWVSLALVSRFATSVE